jgi:myosin heavy subunit
MVTMGETIIVQRNASAAKFCRDSVVKEMYSRIFEWIVTSLNVALDQKTEDVLFIGVLGIFGFERFERNVSEQLLVNYTNEVLQATFNSQVPTTAWYATAPRGFGTSTSPYYTNPSCTTS